MLPITMLRMSLILHFGPKILWSLPINFYEIWQILFLALSYYYIIEAGLILIFSFAAVFYSLSRLHPNTFSSKLTILDSIYFSFITIATVGYGDINPVSNTAKVLVILEILLGLLYMLFIVNIF